MAGKEQVNGITGKSLPRADPHPVPQLPYGLLKTASHSQGDPGDHGLLRPDLSTGMKLGAL